MKRIILAFCGFVFLVSAHAFSEEKYDELPELVISGFSKGKFDDSFKIILSERYQATPQGVADIEKYSAMLKTYGDYRFHKLVSEKTLDERYVLLSYFVGFSEKPMFLSLVMYKPEQKWGIESFGFSSDFNKVNNFSFK